MSYQISATFSNIQNSFGNPTIFIATGIDLKDLYEIELIKGKEYLKEFINEKEGLFDLSLLENELCKFNGFFKTSILKKTYIKSTNQGIIKFIFDGYSNTIDNILSNNIDIYDKTVCYYVHKPLDIEGNEINVNINDHDHKLFDRDIRYYGKEDVNISFEVTRLKAWYKNLIQIRSNKRYIYSQIKTNPKYKYFKMNKLMWPNPDLNYYQSYFVGYPTLKLTGTVNELNMILKPGEFIKFMPISYSCNGINVDDIEYRCTVQSNKKPFGELLSESSGELCAICKNQINSICQLIPQCDGFSEDCKDRDFIDGICHNNYCIYVTLFENTIKVGRSICSNVIRRLIEQGAYDALLFYPIPWLPNAHKIEYELIKILKDEINQFKYLGYVSISDKITKKEKLQFIKNIYNDEIKERNQIYDLIKKIILDNVILNKKNINQIILNKNWLMASQINNLDFREIKMFDKIQGTLKGVIGSYLFTDDYCIDVSRIRGLIVGV